MDPELDEALADADEVSCSPFLCPLKFDDVVHSCVLVCLVVTARLLFDTSNISQPLFGKAFASASSQVTFSIFL